jgi:hypothetical protein
MDQQKCERLAVLLLYDNAPVRICFQIRDGTPNLGIA